MNREPCGSDGIAVRAHDGLFNYYICPQCNATATAASAAGNDQAQSRRYITAAAATTQPTKNPVSKWRAPVSFPVSPSRSGWFDLESMSASTAFVKLPVIMAVEGATRTVKCKRAD